MELGLIPGWVCSSNLEKNIGLRVVFEGDGAIMNC